MVFFSESEIIVGKNDAHCNHWPSGDRVAQWVKRDMGTAFYSHLIRGHCLPPEVIQACILRKLKAIWCGRWGPKLQVVITVPAYFDEMRRKATADAGEMAGLERAGHRQRADRRGLGVRRVNWGISMPPGGQPRGK